MKKIVLFFFLLSTGFCVTGQTVYHFESGLYINASGRYGREAVYTDPLLYNVYTNEYKRPAAGDSLNVGPGNQFVKWQAVKADSMMRLRGRTGPGGGGYVYLTYMSSRIQPALLHVRGNSTVIANGVPHAGDPYGLGWLYIPVQLKKGLNEFYVRGGNITASLVLNNKPVFLNTEDPTLPFIIQQQNNNDLLGALVVINTTLQPLKGLSIRSELGGKQKFTQVEAIPQMSSRKVMFHFDGSAIAAIGDQECLVQLMDKKKILDEKKIVISSVGPTDKYSNTFISKIDGSLQYYAVSPQLPAAQNEAALFLSVHGAGVEAIGQARAYQSKDWGTLVAATNRRPRGFNWEDWGRLDALEVLQLAKEKFKPDPQRIYLTGHSMGGHGTWFLGATYPDQWAAIAPCAGYPTLKGYGSADGLIPDSSTNVLEQMLLRSGNQSDVIRLATNYKPLGIYVFHGDDDRTVSVNYARQMRQILGGFHSDLSYYEYPGGSHWFGNHSVDWNPIFDFFKWHSAPADSSVHTIDFITSHPGISSSYRWAGIHQQLHPLQFSRIQLRRNPANKTISGTTENVRILKFDLKYFKPGDTVNIRLDNHGVVSHIVTNANDTVFLLKEENRWVVVPEPPLEQKGPHRYGTFKEAFNHRMVFVYGTSGKKEENEWSYHKARYDAETWYYRGNGAVDLIPDKEFSMERFKNRGIIIYGNKSTNAAWNMLLDECPIQVERNQIKAGNQTWIGDDLAAYFVWPNPHSDFTSVGVISGSGIKGMQAANANQYFAGASGFPDFMIFSLNMLRTGSSGIKMAGFFDHKWKLSDIDFVQKN